MIARVRFDWLATLKEEHEIGILGYTIEIDWCNNISK